MTIPFGKHRGWAIDPIPTEYLEWIGRKILLREPLRPQARGEFDACSLCALTRNMTLKFKRDHVRLAREVFEPGFWAKAFCFHADKGGSGEETRQLNLLVESVRTQLKTQWQQLPMTKSRPC